MLIQEHYFENLLFHGEDSINKEQLTEKEIEAIELCAQYVLCTIFYNRENFLEYVKNN